VADGVLAGFLDAVRACPWRRGSRRRQLPPRVHWLSHLNGTASPRVEQLIARARGILADPANAEACFDEELADPTGDQWPFERAQLRLDHAEWLRRRRRINDAKPALMEALGTSGG
jgi:hypothetical protein